MCRYVTAFPGALRLNIEAEPYATKLQLLTEELGVEVGPGLVAHPMFLTYSTERIACRAAFLKASELLMHRFYL